MDNVLTGGGGDDSSGSASTEGSTSIAVDERPLLNTSHDRHTTSDTHTHISNTTATNDMLSAASIPLPPYCCRSCPCDCFLWTLLIW
jgi:hypothetical protein